METNAAGQSGYRFYNAGSRVDEQWPFTISATSAGFNPGDGGDTHSIGKYNFVAPKQGWVFVPIEIASGNETIRVNFPEDVKRKYGRRGIVMLDPRHNPESEDAEKALETYPVAPTEALAIARAELLWDAFLDGICSAHFEDVQTAMANGMRPRAAYGFTSHALKMKGYEDPAAKFLQGLKEGRQNLGPQSGSSPEMLGVLQGIAEHNKLMTTLILAIASGQKIDPELLKAVVSHTDTVAPPKPALTNTPMPDNAGTVQVEGVASSSLEARIARKTVETVYDPPSARSKSERAKAAAKEL